MAEIGVTEVVVGLLSGGGLGAWLAFRKTQAETEAISVSTLKGVIEELRIEDARKGKTIDQLAARISELESLQRRDHVSQNAESV